MNKPKILVVDDQIGEGRENSNFRINFLMCVGALPDTAKSESDLLPDYPYEFEFHSGLDVNHKNSCEAVEVKVWERWPDSDGNRWTLVLLDVRFGKDENFGFELLTRLRETFGIDLPIVMLTSEDEIKRSRANRGSADGYLPKDSLDKQNLDRRVKCFGLFPDMNETLRGRSLELLKVLRKARKFASSAQGNLLLLGPTGAGKSALAEFIHKESVRHNGPLMQFFASKSNLDLHSDKIFGHWSGAFTGATNNVAGLAELAHNGIFFLDELAQLHPDTQVLLLEYRHWNSSGFRSLKRLGNHVEGIRNPPLNIVPKIGNKGNWDSASGIILVDTVWISATNYDLEDKDKREKLGFLEDLWWALAGNIVHFPTLAQRGEDLLDLFNFFIKSSTARSGKKEISVDPEARGMILSYDWPGNISQLGKVAGSIAQEVGDFDEVLPRHLPDYIKNSGKSQGKTIKSFPEANVPSSSLTLPTSHSLSGLSSEVLSAGLARLNMEYLHRRVKLLEEALEKTRETDHATGQLTNYAPAAAIRNLLGITLNTTDAQRVISDILGSVMSPNKVDDAALKNHGLNELRAYIKSRPALAEFYEYSQKNKKLEDVNSTLLKRGEL